MLAHSQYLLEGAEKVAYLSQEYILDNNYPRNRWTGKTKDEDSNSFKHTDKDTYRTIWIVRIDGFWHIEEHNAEYILLHYKSSTKTTSKEPICNLSWLTCSKAWNDYGIVNIPSKPDVQNICLSKSGGL